MDFVLYLNEILLIDLIFWPFTFFSPIHFALKSIVLFEIIRHESQKKFLLQGNSF